MRMRVLQLSAMSVFLMTHMTAQGTRGVDVKIALADTSVCQHEPVQLLISVTNLGDRRIAANFGRNGEEFVRIVTRQDSGQWVQDKPPFRSGFAGQQIVRPLPGQQKTLTLIADKWIGALEQGTYQLKVMVHAPATDRSWDPPEDLELAGPIDEEAVVELRVNAPCPSKLVELAASDLAIILAPPTVTSQLRASEHLSYIEDDVAIPYMERAVAPDGIGNQDIMDGLGRIGDEHAKGALTRLSMNSDPIIAAYARRKLSN